MAEIQLWVPDSYAQRASVAAVAPPEKPPANGQAPVPRGLIGSGLRSGGSWDRLVGDKASLGSPTVTRQELVGLWRTHSWVRAGITRIAKIAIQEGWEIVSAPEELEEGEEPDPEGKRYLEAFFRPELTGDIVNIRQWVQPAAKFYLTFEHLKLFGENAWELVKNGLGEDVDFSIIFGRLLPNVDRRGNFLSSTEAYRQVLGRDEQVFGLDEVLRFEVPDVDGRLGVSELESIVLAATTDIWAQVWNRNTFKNNRTPPTAYIFSDNARDEDIKAFKAELDDLYGGATNANKSPVVRGLDKISTLAGAFGKEAEFLRGRLMNRGEMWGLIGVSPGIMGDVTDVNRANLDALIRIVYDMEARPLQELVEGGVNAWRLLQGIRGWKFQFRRLNFENEALEAETSERKIKSGQSTPNQEIVRRGGKPYPGGDFFYMPQGVVVVGEPAEEDRLAEPPEAAEPAPEGPEGGEGEKLASDELVAAELRRWRKMAVRLAQQGKPQRPFETAIVPEPLRLTLEVAVMTAGDVGQIGLLFDAAIEALRPKAERGAVPHWQEWQNDLLQDREDELDSMMDARRRAGGPVSRGSATAAGASTPRRAARRAPARSGTARRPGTG